MGNGARGWVPLTGQEGILIFFSTPLFLEVDKA